MKTESIFAKGIPISFRNSDLRGNPELRLPAKSILGKNIGKIKTAVQEEKDRLDNTVSQIKTIAIIIAICSILSLLLLIFIVLKPYFL